MDFILSNGTWELVDGPYGYKPVGCKWVFKKKLRSDGNIDKYKSQLVAKGYTQKEENEITLTQSYYVEKVLSRFGYKDNKPSPTPYDPSLILRKNRRIGRDQLRYS